MREIKLKSLNCSETVSCVTGTAASSQQPMPINPKVLLQDVMGGKNKGVGGSPGKWLSKW